MAFNVNEFKAKLKKGGARPNQFQVILPFPAVSGGTALTEQFSFMCRAASIPGESLGLIRVPYMGRVLPYPGDRTFEDWTVQVFNDETFDLRDTFERWSNAINGHNSNLRDAAAVSPSGYEVDATVIQYGKSGDVVKEYDVIGIWPQSVGRIDVAYDNNDSIEEFPVTFQMTLWTARTTS